MRETADALIVIAVRTRRICRAVAVFVAIDAFVVDAAHAGFRFTFIADAFDAFPVFTHACGGWAVDPHDKAVGAINDGITVAGC